MLGIDLAGPDQRELGIGAEAGPCGRGRDVAAVGRAVTGVGFQPDFTWIKGRSDADYNYLVDIIRTYPNRLFSNLTDAASTESNTVTSSDSDGFTVGSDAGVNRNNSTYVAWNWKANGAGSSNTAGSITSTVSANTSAGFSIATFTGNGTGGATVGHGLGVTPSMVIVKKRSGVADWAVQHISLGANASLRLNGTDATANEPWWNSTTPSSTVFTLGSSNTINQSGETFVAYCFAQVAGYSDFYKKDLTIDVLGPVGDIVSEWVLKGAFIKEANFGEYNWDTADTAVNLTMTLAIDYAVLNF